MPAPFVPRRDADFNAFFRSFAQLITAAPAKYGVSGAVAAALTASFAAWHAAYTAAVEPITRTSAAIRTKDQQRRASTVLIRRTAAAIRADAAVPDGQKVELGLRRPDAAPARINPPQWAPALTLTHSSWSQHTLHIASRENPGRRAKPPGAVSLVLFRAIADEPATQPDAAPFLGLVTRRTCTIPLTGAEGGTFATYFGRWANAKGELGPWSLPVTGRIAA